MNGKQLKNSILQWAIQGKLVPQDPNDEPASVLLDKIRQEKERLIKEKKIKRDKNASIIYRGEDNSYYEKILATGEVKCIDEEIPFEIPEGWEWCRLKHICSMQAGKNIKATNIFDEQTPKHPYPCVGGNGLRGYTEFYNTDGHFAIVGRQGALCGCLNIEEGRFYATEHAVVIHTYNILSPWFMYYFLIALNLNKYATATAQPGLAVSNIMEVLCPVPPFSEQDRIIKKIEETLSYIDAFNKSQTELQLLNISIREKLKKSILQEAIQGKLVPQKAEEGTAKELLELITEEKQKLVKEGKLKKSALNDSVIFKGVDNRYCEKIGKTVQCIEDEIPFEIPESWEWVRLGTIIDFSKNQSIPSSLIEKRTWVLDLEDIEKDSGKLLRKKRMVDVQSKSDKHVFKKGNVLYSKLRPYLNKVIIADEDGACTTEILAFDFGSIYNRYAQMFLMSPYFVDYATTDSYGIKMPRIGSKRGNNALMPLPPVSEQQRILAQIDKLFEQLR